MARLVTTGFEWNLGTAGAIETSAHSIEPAGLEAPTVQTTTVRSGTYAGKCDSGASDTAPRWTLSINFGLSITLYTRGYFCWANLPAADVLVLGTAPAIRLTTTGKLQLWDFAASAQIGSDSADTVSADGTTWYRLELSHTIGAGGDGTACEFLLNGTSVAAGNLATAVSPSWVFGWNGTPGANKVVYVDDLAVNDSTGSNQTSWPGSGKIVLLKPISDNARGTNWTAGAGGTTNLFTAMDNTPPVGVALASATNTSQIKNVAKDTTGNYDANLATYTTGGLISTDTVNVVQSVWNLGSSAASTISHGMKLVSNPAGGTEDTFTPTAIAGTYPSNWSWRKPTAQTVYAPSVTLGTSPVIRIGKRTSNTAAAMCDAMGLYVDYSPAAPKSLTPTPPFRHSSVLYRV